MSNQVKVTKTRKVDLVDKAAKGRELLENNIAVVSYQNRIWDVGDLLRHLADRVTALKKKQCIPKTACLFKAETYLEDKHAKKDLPNEFY